MVAGSDIMFEENGRILHAVTVTISMIIHAVVRPYEDRAGNFTVVAFCMIDLLGIFSSNNAALQILFVTLVIMLLIVLLIVAERSIGAFYKMVKQTRDLLQSIQQTKPDKKSDWFVHLNKDHFTPLEILLLRPLVAVMSIPRLLFYLILLLLLMIPMSPVIMVFLIWFITITMIFLVPLSFAVVLEFAILCMAHSSPGKIIEFVWGPLFKLYKSNLRFLQKALKFCLYLLDKLLQKFLILLRKCCNKNTDETDTEDTTKKKFFFRKCCKCGNKNKNTKNNDNDQETKVTEEKVIEENGMENEVEEPIHFHNTKVVPINDPQLEIKVDEPSEEHCIATNLLESFDESHYQFTKRHEKKKRRSVAQLQQRLRARQRIKDTKTLKNVPVFAGLRIGARKLIVDKMDYVKIAANEPIVKQGDVTDHFYIVVSGQCRVEVATETKTKENETTGANSAIVTKRVGTLNALDFFGENALLNYKNHTNETSRCHRNATVTAEIGTVQLLSLSTQDFIDLLESNVFNEKIIERMQEMKVAREEMNKKKMNGEVSQAPKENSMTRRMESRFDFNNLISETQNSDALHDPIQLMQGHDAIDMNLKRQISTQRKSSVNRTQMRLLARRRLKQTNALNKIPIFASLSSENIENLINIFEYRIYVENEALCIQGNEADRLFIIISGQCKVTLHLEKNTEKERRVGTLYELDFVGESALLDSIPGTKTTEEKKKEIKIAENSDEECEIVIAEDSDEECEIVHVVQEELKRIRVATVVAEIGSVQVLFLKRDKFEAMMKNEKSILPDDFVIHMKELAEKRKNMNAASFDLVDY